MTSYLAGYVQIVRVSRNNKAKSDITIYFHTHLKEQSSKKLKKEKEKKL